VIVVDASVVYTALTGDNEDGERVRERLRGERLTAPELVDIEVLSVLRRDCLRRALSRRRAEQALADLEMLPIERMTHLALVSRCWELRDNLTAYDAAYVSVAEALEVPLLTADARIAAAPGLRCDVELLA
jgi:predicted nucleic acid-binding protein